MNPAVLLLVIPGILTVVSGVSTSMRVTDLFNAAGYLVYAVVSVMLIRRHLSGEVWAGDSLFRPDALSLILLIVLSLIGLAGALYSPPFIRGIIRRNNLNAFKYNKYFIFYNLLFLSMTLLVLTDNMGIMWVSIEGTTLVSALLVSFDDRKEAVEAAWRYLLICSIGIAFALFGTILTYYSSIQGVGAEDGSLSWSVLVRTADKLDPKAMKLAFIFLLLGYGTKAGLVPMARWKPRTYGEAPASVSAVLSGALVACSVYALARVAILSSAVLGSTVVGNYLIFFGVLSVAFAAPIIVAENDMKRMFAYSSIEHVGLITAGLGFGTFFGIYGALLHILNNALIKTAIFFSAGNLISFSGEQDVRNISCMMKRHPVVTAGLLSAVVAVTATPPFSMFLSEFNMLKAGILSGKYISVTILLISLFIVFSAFYIKFSRVAFGREVAKEGLTEISGIQQMVPLALLSVVLVLGFYIPSPLHRLITETAAMFGVHP